MRTVVKVNELRKNFGQEDVIKGISLDISENTFTVILGQSGSGKTTFLNLLSGLLRPTAGKIVWENTDITALSDKKLAEWKRREVGHVFQNYLLLNNLTAEENIRIGIVPGKTPLSFDRLTRILQIDTCLDKFPAQLSGGQQQRVAIARAVIKNPSLLFCDEATGSLDEANGKAVIELLHHLKATFGLTVLFTTHNQRIAETADRVLTIKDGYLHRDQINESPVFAGDLVWGL